MRLPEIHRKMIDAIQHGAEEEAYWYARMTYRAAVTREYWRRFNNYTLDKEEEDKNK